MVVNERADDTELVAHLRLGDMAPIGMIEVHWAEIGNRRVAQSRRGCCMLACLIPFPIILNDNNLFSNCDRSGKQGKIHPHLSL
jgi:hypothetical protein